MPSANPSAVGASFAPAQLPENTLADGTELGQDPFVVYQLRRPSERGGGAVVPRLRHNPCLSSASNRFARVTAADALAASSSPRTALAAASITLPTAPLPKSFEYPARWDDITSMSSHSTRTSLLSEETLSLSRSRHSFMRFDSGAPLTSPSGYYSTESSLCNSLQPRAYSPSAAGSPSPFGSSYVHTPVPLRRPFPLSSTPSSTGASAGPTPPSYAEHNSFEVAPGNTAPFRGLSAQLPRDSPTRVDRAAVRQSAGQIPNDRNLAAESSAADALQSEVASTDMEGRGYSTYCRPSPPPPGLLPSSVADVGAVAAESKRASNCPPHHVETSQPQFLPPSVLSRMEHEERVVEQLLHRDKATRIMENGEEQIGGVEIATSSGDSRSNSEHIAGTSDSAGKRKNVLAWLFSTTNTMPQQLAAAVADVQSGNSAVLGSVCQKDAEACGDKIEHASLEHVRPDPMSEVRHQSRLQETRTCTATGVHDARREPAKTRQHPFENPASRETESLQTGQSGCVGGAGEQSRSRHGVGHHQDNERNGYFAQVRNQNRLQCFKSPAVPKQGVQQSVQSDGGSSMATTSDGLEAAPVSCTWEESNTGMRRVRDNGYHHGAVIDAYTTQDAQRATAQSYGVTADERMRIPLEDSGAAHVLDQSTTSPEGRVEPVTRSTFAVTDRDSVFSSSSEQVGWGRDNQERTYHRGAKEVDTRQPSQHGMVMAESTAPQAVLQRKGLNAPYGIAVVVSHSDQVPREKYKRQASFGEIIEASRTTVIDDQGIAMNSMPSFQTSNIFGKPAAAVAQGLAYWVDSEYAVPPSMKSKRSQDVHSDWSDPHATELDVYCQCDCGCIYESDCRRKCGGTGSMRSGTCSVRSGSYQSTLQGSVVGSSSRRSSNPQPPHYVLPDPISMGKTDYGEAQVSQGRDSSVHLRVYQPSGQNDQKLNQPVDYFTSEFQQNVPGGDIGVSHVSSEPTAGPVRPHTSRVAEAHLQHEASQQGIASGPKRGVRGNLEVSNENSYRIGADSGQERISADPHENSWYLAHGLGAPEAEVARVSPERKSTTVPAPRSNENVCAGERVRRTDETRQKTQPYNRTTGLSAKEAESAVRAGQEAGVGSTYSAGKEGVRSFPQAKTTGSGARDNSSNPFSPQHKKATDVAWLLGGVGSQPEREAEPPSGGQGKRSRRRAPQMRYSRSFNEGRAEPHGVAGSKTKSYSHPRQRSSDAVEKDRVGVATRRDAWANRTALSGSRGGTGAGGQKAGRGESSTRRTEDQNGGSNDVQSGGVSDVEARREGESGRARDSRKQFTRRSRLQTGSGRRDEKGRTKSGVLGAMRRLLSSRG